MFDRRLIEGLKSKRSVGFLLTVGLLLGHTAGTFAGESVLTLGLARELAESLEPPVREFAEVVSSMSGGSIRPELVAVEPGRDLLQMARLGKLDLAVVPNTETAAISPEFDVLELPFLFAGREHVARVMRGPVGRELLNRLERVRLHGLAFWDLAEVHISTRDVPIEHAEAMRGLRLGIDPDDEYLVRVIEELGGGVVPISPAERYQALQTGVIDAAEVRLAEFLESRYYELQETLALTRHRYLAAAVVINWGRFEALDPPHRELLEEAAREIGERLGIRHAEEDERIVDEIRRRGVRVVNNPDVQLAHDIAWKLVYWEYAKTSSFDVLDAIERLR